MENLSLYLLTYNVGTSNPEEDQIVRNMLSLADLKNEKLPDFFALGFQEVKAQPQNMLMDTLFEDPWSYACKEMLKRDYIKLKLVRLQGLLLVVFCLKKHLLSVREIESEYTRTGLAGMWGNKGAVSIRFSIYGCSVCFVNSHLSAHDNQLKDRVEDYNNIVKDQEFHVPETSKIFYHDYVFWMGDLNFRLVEEFDKTPYEIDKMIKKNDLKELFLFDQLRYVMRKGEAFHELTEQDPSFPPTFKFDVGSSSYNYKRRPAWCDRILYCVNSNNYENVTLKVNQLSYKCHTSIDLSDHRPVTAEFIIKVFSDYSERVVEFEKISSWDEKDENKATYCFTKDIPPTKEDWIGLFKHNFTALDEYLTYEYVSKCSTPTEDSRNSSSSSMQRPQKFEITFPDIPGSRADMKYCLVYFSQTEDKVMSVLGISDSFPIVKHDSD